MKHHPNELLCRNNRIRSKHICMDSYRLPPGCWREAPGFCIPAHTSKAALMNYGNLWRATTLDVNQLCVSCVEIQKVIVKQKRADYEMLEDNIEKNKEHACAGFVCVAIHVLLCVCVHLRHLMRRRPSCATPPRTITSEVAPDPRCHGHRELASPWPAASFFEQSKQKWRCKTNQKQIVIIRNHLLKNEVISD